MVILKFSVKLDILNIYYIYIINIYESIIMSKLLKKLKPGVRVIDLKSGREGWVTYNDLTLPNSITVEFEINKDTDIGAITYPISDIENRIKLAPKYGNYKVGDRVKISENIDDYISNDVGVEGFVENIDEGIVVVSFYGNIKIFTLSGRLVDKDYFSDKPVLKKLKVKQ